MRRALQILAVLITLVSLSVGIAVAVAPSAQKRSVTPLSETTHVLHYFKNGPGAFCEIKKPTAKCGVAATEPATFRLPSGASNYSCTLTASIQYRTVGVASFGFVVNIFTGNGTVRMVPAARPVASTHGVADSRTLVYRPGTLRSGVSYQLDLDTQLSPDFKVQGSSSISTSHILADLECTPVSRSV